VTKDELLAMLHGREPLDDRERHSIERFGVELDGLADPYDEHAPVHVTCSAIIVGERGVVLHRHRVLQTWVAPGGHIDDGESPEDAVLREAAKETGPPVRHVADGPRLVHVDVHDGPHGHRHLDLRYLLTCDDVEPAPPPRREPRRRLVLVDGRAGDHRAVPARSPRSAR
jgi:8-oxo-dGTP pyrophosphatase MutT (NUDIX family)